MEREKQIEEMALDIMKVSSLPLEISGAIAIDLTEKGYHKESEIVAEVLSKVKELVKEYMLDKGLYLATLKHALNYAEKIIKGAE